MPFAALAFFAAVQAASPEPPVIVTGRGGVPFISPMGEPIRARTPNEDTLARWFYEVDTNRDGFLSAAELQAYAERYFVTLDTNADGQIDPDELVHYEWTIAPEIQVNSRLRRARAPGEPAPKSESDDRKADRERRQHDRAMEAGPQGAGRYALIDMPEPVASADADFNRAITLQEFKQAALDRFQVLDKKREGRVSLVELEAMKPVLPANGKWPKRRKDQDDTRIGQPLPPEVGTDR